jgi:hypothetical protein
MMFYIATSLERAKEHTELRLKLEALGHECTYNWVPHGSVQHLGSERITEVAQAEIDGVMDADVVIVLLPGGRGTHAELGAAIGACTSEYIYVVGEMKDGDGRECAFYYHPDVVRVKDVEELLACINAAYPVGTEVNYDVLLPTGDHLPGCVCAACTLAS